MESSSLTQPIAKMYANGSGEDRISNLLNELRHQIFSFLRTRDVVLTSVLSKRWSYFWASMHYLDFYDEDFREGQTNFVHFVDTVLLLREESDVHTFRLRWHSEDFKKLHLSSWIHYAVKHNVKEFSIIVASDIDDMDAHAEDVDLPNCMFTCQSLEKMNLIFNLRMSINLSSTMFIELGRIKYLGLSCINHDGLLDKIISGCPLLEDLRLFHCSLKNLDISSCTMKSLYIEGCRISGDMIRISIPSLACLYFLHNVLERREILPENLSSLHSAFVQTDDYHDPGLWFIWGNADDTKPLKFIAPIFKMTENSQAVAHFLQRAPNLEMLTLENPALNELPRMSTKLSSD